MTLLDRFRAQSRDKHSDPAVRLAFVEELPLSEKEAIAAAAREDDDPRVRKAAVAKLMDPVALAGVVRDERDENVRAQAAAMLRDLALEAFEEVTEAESLLAIDAIADPKTLAQIAKTATREASAIARSWPRHGCPRPRLRGPARRTRADSHERVRVAARAGCARRSAGGGDEQRLQGHGARSARHDQ